MSSNVVSAMFLLLWDQLTSLLHYQREREREGERDRKILLLHYQRKTLLLKNDLKILLLKDTTPQRGRERERERERETERTKRERGKPKPERSQTDGQANRQRESTRERLVRRGCLYLLLLPNILNITEHKERVISKRRVDMDLISLRGPNLRMFLSIQPAGRSMCSPNRSSEVSAALLFIYQFRNSLLTML